MMHWRAARTLIAILAAALLAPASAGAYTITAQPKPEGDGLVFAITPQGPAEIAAVGTTDFDPQSGSATEGADFDGAPRKPTPSTTPGQWTLTVPTIEDNVDELDETVVLRGGGASGEGTITDDDPPPALSIADATVIESAGGTAMRISAPNPSAGPVVIPLSTNGAGDLTIPASVTLPPGGTVVDVPVTVINDFDDELDDRFTVTLGKPDNATLADAEGVVTITNDDLRVVDVMDAGTPEGSTGTSNARFEVRLNAPTFRRVTVRFTTSDGLARAPADYLARAGIVTFEPGQTIQTIDVAVVADDRTEPPEAFALWLTEVSDARLGDAVAVGVISDDDGGPPADLSDDVPPTPRLTAPKARGRRVTLRITCPTNERACAGRVTLFTVRDRRSKARLLRRERRLGAKSFNLRGGASKTLTYSLPSSVLRAARSAGRLKVQAFAVTQDAGGNVDTRSKRATLRYRRS